MRDSLARLDEDIAACRLCPRLVQWRERVAREKTKRFMAETYWGRPVPGFGDPGARLLLVGLAPAAHGGNRTGRVFTGDRSGDWLFRALHKAGFANQAESTGVEDGLVLTDCRVAAAARCAPPDNKPLPEEFACCRPFLLRELRLLPDVRVVIGLGKVGFDLAFGALAEVRGFPPRPRPRFAHLCEAEIAPGLQLLGSFHPSQQNTFTGRLTEPMFDAVFARARAGIRLGHDTFQVSLPRLLWPRPVRSASPIVPILLGALNFPILGPTTEASMDKKIVILALLGAAGGVALGIFRSPERKGAAAQEAFPPEKLQGQVENTRIKVVEAGQVRGAVIAWAISPYGIKPEQVSPTGYGALKAVRKSYPDANWISVYIAEDSAMAEAANFVALAELRDGAVTVTGGHPTKAQLDSLAGMGQPIRRPTPDDLKVTAAVFDSTGGLASDRWDLARTLMGATGHIDKDRFANLDLETATLHSVAKSLGKPPKEVQKTVISVTRYYWLRAGDPL